MKVAIYSRKSKVTGKGESIKNQIDLCKEYMEKYFKVEEFIVYEDEGFSGGDSDRPQYKKMIRDAKSKKFSTLICYRLDRISRNISDFSDTIEILKTLDIAFISLREQFDTSTPMGRAMMYIASVFAQLERETIAERIKDNMLSLSRTGRWLGGNPPTGYVSEPAEYYDDEFNKKTMYKLKQVPSEIAVVKDIFYKYLELGSLNQVEVWSISKNIRTSRGNFFDITGIRAILTNMVYVKADEVMFNYCKGKSMDISSPKTEFDGKYGLMVYNKNIIKKGSANKLRPTDEWIVAVGQHKGIVSSQEFLKVQENILKNKVRAPKSIKNNISLLTPILKCDCCGSNLRTTYGRKRKDGTRLYYYKCVFKEKSRGQKCSVDNLNGRKTDRVVLEFLKEIKISHNDYYRSLRENKKLISSLSYLNDSTYESKSREIKRYEGKIRQLTEMLSITQDSKSSKYIIKQIEELDTLIVDCNRHLEDVSKKHKINSSDMLHIDSLANMLSDFNIDFLSNIEKKHILDTVIDSVIWNGNSLNITAN